jgi:hypothetical protein
MQLPHRHVPWQQGERPDVEMVDVQMRHDGQIRAERPVAGRRPPPSTQVPQPRAEQRIGEDTRTPRSSIVQVECPHQVMSVDVMIGIG